jgi:hypothetical protein
MDFDLEICAESGLLRVTATGEFSIEEAKRSFLDILDAVAHHKTGKILLDGREITGEPTTIERFFYGEFAAHEVAKFIHRHQVPGPQFAYVLHEPVLDPQRFGETVAVNRGVWVKVFDNLEEALGWLGANGANGPGAGDA